MKVFCEKSIRLDSYFTDERALQCNERFLSGNRDFCKVKILITKEGCQNMVKLFWDL